MTDRLDSKRPTIDDYERALESMGSYVDVDAGDVMVLAERAEQFARQRTSESLDAARIMTSPVRVVRPDTRMSQAAHLMVGERIGALVVVDEAERLVGIITESDFLRGLGLPAPYPTHNVWQTLESVFGHFARQPAPEGPDDPVSAYMVRDVVAAPPDANVHDILALMKRHWVTRVVVCGEDRRVLGIITRTDLVRLFFDRYAAPVTTPAQFASPPCSMHEADPAYFGLGGETEGAESDPANPPAAEAAPPRRPSATISNHKEK